MTEQTSPTSLVERDKQLLDIFHTLDDLGQNLALVLLKALAGNPNLQARHSSTPTDAA